MNDLKVPHEDMPDTVNAEQFWDQVEKEILARGLVKGIYLFSKVYELPYIHVLPP